jgi:hypothetical protein
MAILVGITALSILSTKAMDCISTLHAVPHPDAEINPLARRIMHRIGVRGAAALAFALTVVIVAIATALTLLSPGTFHAWCFVGGGILVSVVQSAVAHTNWTGRWNVVTRLARRLLHRLKQ